jgi:hypothetical protein
LKIHEETVAAVENKELVEASKIYGAALSAQKAVLQSLHKFKKPSAAPTLFVEVSKTANQALAKINKIRTALPNHT